MAANLDKAISDIPALQILESHVTATFAIDASGKVILWNRACEKLTGVPAETVLGTDEHWKAFYSSQRPCLADAVLMGLIDEVENLYDFFIHKSVDDGTLYAQNWCVMPNRRHRLYLTLNAGPVFDASGHLLAIVETMSDSSDEKKNQTMLESLASTDPLTNTANRRVFDRTLQETCDSNNTPPTGLIFLDIDYFKNYNDHYGHLQGDECLKCIAREIRQSLFRDSDTVFRFGGEEFCILLPKTPSKGVLMVAERIRENIENLHVAHATSKISPWVTVSCGCDLLPENRILSPKEWIGRADEALYHAKAQGRNRVVMWQAPEATPTLPDAAQRP